MDKAILVLNFTRKNNKIDVETPLNISSKDFVIALNIAYNLGIDTDDISKCYLRSENPIALLKGNRTLEEYGVHTGTMINIF